MNRGTSILAIALLVLNLLGIAYLVAEHRDFLPKSSRNVQISTSELAQLDKLFKLAVEFRSELENIAGKAVFPTEKKKREAAVYLQDHQMAFERSRLAYNKLQEERTQDAAVRFISLCWGDNELFSSLKAIDVSKYRFAEYNQAQEEYIPYANVSFVKLDAINNEFRVLALSLLKDIK